MRTPPSPFFLLLALVACGDGGWSKDSGSGAGKAGISITIVSPEDGATVSANKPLQLEVTAARGEREVNVTAADWTVGGWTGSGASTSWAHPSPGSVDVVVDAVVEGEHFAGSAHITIEGGGGDADTDTDADGDADADADSDTDADTGPWNYSGTMSAHVWYDYSGYTGDGDCPGSVSGTLTTPDFVGTGACTLPTDAGDFEVPFRLEGTVKGGKNSGDLILTQDGQDYRTPYDGSGNKGEHIGATYDKEFKQNGDTIRIAGSWSADPI